MKKGILLLLLGTLMLVRLEGHAELTYPEGGETFQSGAVVEVTWQEVIQHDPLNWDLFFSSDGGETWDTIQIDIPYETLSYQWNVPGIQTDMGRIKIVQDNVADDYESISNDFTITSVTGIGDPHLPVQIKVSPNPLINYTIIEFDNPLHISHTLSLYNMQGREIRSIPNITAGNVQVERKHLAAGLYLILLRDENEIRAAGKLEVR